MSMLSTLALLVGCTPHDAEVQAQYAVYFGASSSENIDRLVRTGTDVDAQAGKLGLVPVDCRDLSYLETSEEIDAARLPNVDYESECEGDPEWFDWINQYAYYLKEGDVDAWRTEAVMTSEGDFQLTVHTDMGEFGDFRFGWVIDPVFQPKECVDGADGKAVEQDVDGDWVAGWSEGEDGSLWMLNSGTYQVNPSDNGDSWVFEDEWQAGTSFARLGDEEFYSWSIDYADPLYRPFYVNTYTGDCGDGGDNDYDDAADNEDSECRRGLAFEGPQIPASTGDVASWVEATRAYFNTDDSQGPLKDLAHLGKSSFPLEMKIEDNSWREMDDVSAGLDGWLGVSANWVRIDNPQDIGVHPENPITGEFEIFMAGLAASSKILVKGSFTIDNVRDDVWGYSPTLEERKMEENNTPTCGEDRLTTDAGE